MTYNYLLMMEDVRFNLNLEEAAMKQTLELRKDKEGEDNQPRIDFLSVDKLLENQIFATANYLITNLDFKIESVKDLDLFTKTLKEGDFFGDGQVELNDKYHK